MIVAVSGTVIGTVTAARRQEAAEEVPVEGGGGPDGPAGARRVEVHARRVRDGEGLRLDKHNVNRWDDAGRPKIAPQKSRIFLNGIKLIEAANQSTSAALAADAPGELHVLGEDGDALAVDGEEVGVLEETDEVRLARLLQGQDSARLEPELGAKLLRELADEAAERTLAEEEIGRLLVLADLPEREGARAVAKLLGDLLEVGHDLRAGDGREVLGRRLARQSLAGSRALVDVLLDGGVLGASHAGLGCVWMTKKGGASPFIGMGRAPSKKPATMGDFDG